MRVVDELPGQLGQLGVALGQRGQVRQPLAHRLGRGLGGPAAGEQPERAAVGGVDQLDDLVELGLRRGRRGRAAAGAGRRRGSPAGRSRTASRRRGRARAARRRPLAASAGPSRRRSMGLSPSWRPPRRSRRPSMQGRAGEDHGLVGEQLVAHRAPHLQRRHAQRAAASARRPRSSHSTSLVGVGGHPLGGRRTPPGPSPWPGCGRRRRRRRRVLGVGREAGPGRVAHQRQRVGELLREARRCGRAAVVDRVAQRVAGVGEVVGLGRRRRAAASAGRPARRRRRAQLVGGGLGHPGDQLVGLVDHDDVVVGDHRHALDRVDREQRVVGDDQVGAVRLLAGQLGEALLAERALGARPRHSRWLTLTWRHSRSVCRGALSRSPVPPSLGLLLGPRPQLEHLRCPSSPRAPRPARPGRRARPRGCGAGRRSWSGP